MLNKIRIKPVTIKAHPNLYGKMEEIRKHFQKNNIALSQVELTNMIAKKVIIPKINIMGLNNDKRKKRKSY